MNRFTPRFLTLVVLAVLLGLPLATVVGAQTPGLTDHPAWQPDNPQAAPEPTADEPATIAERLFVGLLDRFPSALEHEQAAQQIDAGELDGLLNTLLGSSEYKRLRATKTPNSLLEQYYDGLLDRAPNSSDYRTWAAELDRGNDAGVVRALLESNEFDEMIAGQSLEASPLETSCMQEVEKRVSSELRRETKLRFLTVATSTKSFISKGIRGTAELPDRRGIDFACTTERLTDSIVDVAYRISEEVEPQPVIVRCESPDQRRRECAADTHGGVTLVRQLSRVSCRENVNWGYSASGIWVDRGCGADFRVEASEAEQSLELAAEGSGFLYQAGSPPVWFSRAQLECRPDGSAQLTLTGRSTVSVSGGCYRLEETRLELGLTGSSGDWYTEGGGSVTVADGSLSTVSVAGRSRLGQPFTITFRVDAPEIGEPLTRKGDGHLDLADGRRVSATSVRLEPDSNGRVTFFFDGQARVSFTGSWFQAWTGDYEVTLSGGLNDSTTRGAGTVGWSEDGSLSIELVGTATSVGGAFRLTFEGRATNQ